MKKILSEIINPIDPKKLELVAAFGSLDHEENALFALGEKRLFIVRVTYCCGPKNIMRGSGEVPFNEARPDDFREIGLKEALQWYVRWERREDWRDSDGEVSLLCELAAEQLKD